MGPKPTVTLTALLERVKKRVKKSKARLNSLSVEQVIFENECFFILSAFKEMESNMLSNFTISKPFADYSSNSYKESIRRQLVRWFLSLFEIIGCIRLLILTLNFNEEMWRALGRNFYVLPDHEILSASIFGINALITIFRLVMHWCDVKGKLTKFKLITKSSN